MAVAAMRNAPGSASGRRGPTHGARRNHPIQTASPPTRDSSASIARNRDAVWTDI